MQAFWKLAVTPVLLAMTISMPAAVAQSDAEIALRDARTAMAADQFQQARDLLRTASQTDSDNPDIYLLLGRAHYQLGELDAAIDAWQRTLQLAPEQAYARRMVDALRGKRVDADVRLDVIDALLHEGLAHFAQRDIETLKTQSLSDQQRIRLLLLEAETLIDLEQSDAARKLIGEVKVRAPEQAETARLRLLLGKALLASADRQQEGQTILQQLTAEAAESDEAAAAELALLILRMNRDHAGEQVAELERLLVEWLSHHLQHQHRIRAENAVERAASMRLTQITSALHDGDVSAKVLATWAAEHPEHPRLQEARRRLVAAYLAETKRQQRPVANHPLSQSDKQAVAVVGRLLDSSLTDGDQTKLIQSILDHLNQHYAGHGAYGAAVEGQRAILELSLPNAIRYAVLTQLANTQAAAAIDRLTAEVAAGTIAKTGLLPDDLVALQQTLTAINERFPAQPSLEQQSAIAFQLAALSEKVDWPATVTQIKSTDSWALTFAVPVIVADQNASATKRCHAVMEKTLKSIAILKQHSIPDLASKTQMRLLAALDQQHSGWPVAVLRQLQLRVAEETKSLQEHHSLLANPDSLQLSESQQQLIDLAAKLVAQVPSMASKVLSELQPLIQVRIDFGNPMAAADVYARLESALPPTQRRSIQFAVIESTIARVVDRHNRQIELGFAPARELDPELQAVLKRCYELQSDLDPEHPFVLSVQQARGKVIAHYRDLQYDDAAAAAIAVKGEIAVDWLDTKAEFQAISLQLAIALDELERSTHSFQGTENLQLTAVVSAAIDRLEQFVTAHLNDPLATAAIDKVLSVGKTYQGYSKFDIAAGVYSRLETFANGVDALQHAVHGGATIAERAAAELAAVKHAKARVHLKLAIESQAADTFIPQEISPEFAAAIEAYQKLIGDDPDGPFVRMAIDQWMAIAFQYADVAAWDVASEVYGHLLQQPLALKEPGRLELAQAVCQLGKVMPVYARSALAAITAGESPAGIDTLNRPTGQMSAVQRPEEISADASVAAGGSSSAAELQERALRHHELLAAVQTQQSELASQVAMLRDEQIRQVISADVASQIAQQVSIPAIAGPVLSEAEIGRRRQVLDGAYRRLIAIRQTHPDSNSSRQAREQIMVIVNHWRSLRRWELSAELVKQYLADTPGDPDLPQLRQQIARDYLAWAAAAEDTDASKQQLLDEVNRRFKLAREELAAIIAAFPQHTELQRESQWDIAGSHLTQARVVAKFSSTLARGQFVRAATELLATADKFHDHPNIRQVPEMLWSISGELTQRQFWDEAITVWNELTLHYPAHALSQQAAVQIAETYQSHLQLPLRAVETYLELNFARGGSDVTLQDAIFGIASQLMSEKRWVESLHVLETFVDSFPEHASAGQALTMIGQVHQTNEVWEDAIEAYSRVIAEYDAGNWAQQAKWSIAECTINLSRWDDARDAYRDFQQAYPDDERTAEAAKRLVILKDLARFQNVVDEEGQRKAFDAQYQIARIVQTQLANPVKSIIEYRRVAQRWPNSHLADDALFQVGTIYMELSQTERARDAFLATASQYPSSPLADDALFQVGASFENEAQALVGVTRGKAIVIANELAQRQAYAVSQDNRRTQRMRFSDQIQELKKAGKRDEADKQSALQAAMNVAFDQANAAVVANWAAQQEQALTTAQLADRQDKINAALRRAVSSFRQAASITSADMADDALLRMAQIYDQRLHDSESAMATWLEIVKQYSGTTVAEDASWRIAKYYESHQQYAQAIDAYNSFLRNYRRSPKASQAQAAIAENHEQLGNWVEAMDAYTNYINNYPEGGLASKAKEQIAWIKTYRL